jgi:hypothetical protein
MIFFNLLILCIIFDKFHSNGLIFFQSEYVINQHHIKIENSSVNQFHNFESSRPVAT